MRRVRQILSGRAPERTLCVVAALLAVPLVPALYTHATNDRREQECRANLRVIYQAIQNYRREHGGAYPPLLVSSLAPLPPEEKPESLAPRYLPQTERLICPADFKRGDRGYALPSSYEYQLQELSWPDPKVRRRVQTELIDHFSSHLRLVQCVAYHPGCNGFLTLRADGYIGAEPITIQDPQKRVRQSLWDAALKAIGSERRSRPPSAGKPASSHGK